MCKKCKKSNEFKVLSKILKKALKKIESRTGYAGHSVEPKRYIFGVDSNESGIESSKGVFVRTCDFVGHKEITIQKAVSEALKKPRIRLFKEF